MQVLCVARKEVLLGVQQPEHISNVSRIQGSKNMDMCSFILTQENNNDYIFTWIKLTFLNKGLEAWVVYLPH